MAGVWSYIRSSLLAPMNTNAKPPVTPPINARMTGPGGPVQDAVHMAGVTAPVPHTRCSGCGVLQKSWPEPARNAQPQTANDPPQTKTQGGSTNRGVGYYKILARTRANAQPQTHGMTRRNETANDPPQTKTAGRTHTTHRTSRSTGPQYPAPAAVGVGYCKILNQNPHTPPTTNLLNDTPQTKTVNKPPRTKTTPSRERPNGPGPDWGI
ncbi:hypothetical protein BS47DRAFT_1370108 [Hydnum rufescens UP504]|uniref:Uncharacterized protein n=1 Tax=Hydnum rufescens UP504 TaxID=1448309 RepID=A0A9P6AA80_9AGAM|nr:hypothetical protein BS47DRAFT_1370108 [Hydnum rufescens UP504]